jgi:hypothetical protein
MEELGVLVAQLAPFYFSSTLPVMRFRDTKLFILLLAYISENELHIGQMPPFFQ